jgi:peptide deformylase
MIVNMSSLIKEDNEVLRKRAEEVELPLSEGDLDILKAMAIFVMESQTKEKDELGNLYVPSVGLAAPQIGISKRMFVIATADDNNDLVVLAFVNPTIENVKKNFISLNDGEGCLSVQSVKNGKIPRYETIRYNAYIVDLKTGETEKKTMGRLDGYLGIVFQHEYDHLEGILITDIMEKEEAPEKKEESK